VYSVRHQQAAAALAPDSLPTGNAADCKPAVNENTGALPR